MLGVRERRRGVHVVTASEDKTARVWMLPTEQDARDTTAPRTALAKDAESAMPLVTKREMESSRA